MSEQERFAGRHIGPRDDEVASMLRTLGYADVPDLVTAAVPEAIRWIAGLDLPPARSETQALADLSRWADLNVVCTSMIGLGYADTVTPAVIRRNLLENPAWYTAYTPYQPEISQGRLEALLTFQTMIEDLTGLPVANASLLDEPTAAAEAMLLARRGGASKSARYWVDADTHPQTKAVLATRAAPLGLTLVEIDPSAALPAEDAFGLLLSYPGSSGTLRDHSTLIEQAHARGAMVAVTTDLLALTLVRPPGELGADVVVGSAQRFGVPLGFGGPHAGFMSIRSGLERSLPGRLVGVSVDAEGQPAYRLALQTREQHIRRDRATSNICTAQVLLAVIAAMYATYHGPDGLRRIAERVHRHAVELAAGMRALGLVVESEPFFDTVTVGLPGRAAAVVAAAADRRINLRLVDADRFAVSTDEVTESEHVLAVLAACAEVLQDAPGPTAASAAAGATGTAAPGHDPESAAHPRPEVADALPRPLLRTTAYLSHPVFHEHHSETAMMRYLRRLADRDIALDRAMIPLGSCTMKLNAAAEMEPISWPGWARIHPFAPAEQTRGYTALIEELSTWLCEITGYDAVSLQPNAGSQGELAGLLAIRGYHRSRGAQRRDVCLIPASAHGTNAASAVLAGLRVVVVRCDADGNVDLEHLAKLVDTHRDRLAAVMVTYPSTHGVYEEAITELCALVHDAGGQVYVDGANLNALVGWAKPGRFGADVSHLNLHKTFTIPHGGGGPGVGPVACRQHLAAFLPGHPLRPDVLAGRSSAAGAVSGAPWGSAGILPIPWAYIAMMGPDGLAEATGVAVLAANYVAHQLREAYPILYTGRSGLVAHECILDLREITRTTGVTVDDVAKRLIDYGFHAPTMSFPVAGTLMVEPTESENLAELDRFCAAMLAIRAEIDAVAAGEWPVADSPLRGAPHTAACLMGEWTAGYDRMLAAYPLGPPAATGPNAGPDKYWPPVRRIDGAYGDRHLMCSCPSPAEVAETSGT